MGEARVIGLAAFEHAHRQRERAALLRALVARARPQIDFPNPWVPWGTERYKPLRRAIAEAGQGGRIVRWTAPGFGGHLHFPSECYVHFAPGCRLTLPLPPRSSQLPGVAAILELDLPEGLELHSYDDEGWPVYRMPGKVSRWRQLSILPFCLPFDVGNV